MDNVIQVTQDNPFAIGDKTIVAMKAEKMYFQAFAKILEAVQQDTTNTPGERLVMRKRMLAQVTCQVQGNKDFDTKLDDLSLLTLPARYALKLSEMLNADDPMGEVLGKGDGTNTPIHYKFGTPLTLADGSTITEIEFIAKTYGTVEGVLTETSSVQQALAMLATCAIPVASKPALQAMPVMALDQVTITDGLVIANEVVKAFLGSGEDS